MLEILRNLYRLGELFKIEESGDGHILVPKGKLHLGTMDNPIGSINMDDKTIHMIKESGADYERLTTTYDPGNAYYTTKVEKGGTGVLRDLVIAADGTTEQIRVKTDGSVLIPGLVSAFTDHTDTPGSYSGGDAGKIVTVNGTEDGVEFIAPGVGVDIDEFVELTDTPGSFGAVGDILQVNATTDGLEFTTPVPETFIGLPDTPLNYTGAAGQVVQVKGTEDGVEFVPPVSSSIIDLITVAEAISTTQTFNVLTIPASTLSEGDFVEIWYSLASGIGNSLDNANRLEVLLRGTDVDVILFDSSIDTIPSGTAFLGRCIFAPTNIGVLSGMNTTSIQGGSTINTEVSSAHNVANTITIEFKFTASGGIVGFNWAMVALK